MYENITFETILKRMLDRIPPDMDKREGSIIYDALAPAAVELQLMYIELDVILKETFGDTASREYLIRRAAERGIVPYQATPAVLKAIAVPYSVNVQNGSRFSLNTLNFTVIEKIGDDTYKLQCETAGTIGNSYTGIMTPINYIDGLESMTAVELLIHGENEEKTEDIRKRYQETFDTKAFGGNQKDYIDKTSAIAGVGGVKVIPAWNGGGSVLLIIQNSEFGTASPELVSDVQEIIDPTQLGDGVGIAPIGHQVTVKSVKPIIVKVSTMVTFQDGYSFLGQQEELEMNIENYFLDIRKNWEHEPNSVVRISHIETAILQTAGVIDVSRTTINGTSSNLILNPDEIPKLGGVISA